MGHEGGLRQGIWNLASTILGAGALGLPVAIKAPVCHHAVEPHVKRDVLITTVPLLRC